MNQEKLFQKKALAGGEQFEGGQKPKVSKRGAAPPAKAKKAEQTKKVQKKTEEPPVVTVWWTQFRQYLWEVSYELRKVIWPSRKETIGSTAIVLIIVILSAIYLGIVDAVLSRLVGVLVR